MDTFLAVAAFVVILIGIITFLTFIEKFKSKRRRITIIPKATQLGFMELPLAMFDLKKNYPPFLLLDRADLIHDLVLQRRLDGGKLQHVFDIEIRSGQGQTEKMTVCLTRLSGTLLPKFMIKGKDKTRITMRFLHDIKRFTQGVLHNYHTLSLESSEKFQQDYKLLAPFDDKGAVERLFTPELIQLFETHTGWQAEGMKEWLLLYRRGIVVKPSQFSDFVNECKKMAEGFFKSCLKGGK